MFLKNNLLSITLTRKEVDLALDSGNLKTSQLVWTTAQGLKTSPD